MLRSLYALLAVSLGSALAGWRSHPAADSAPQIPVARAPAISASGAQTGDSLTIALITMGVGAGIGDRFGHSAILIHDGVTGTDSVYNWGVYDSTAPYFIPRFLRGLMTFSTDGTTLTGILRTYRRLERSVWMQTLDLTAAEKLEIRDFIRWNERLENANYRYNYFTDNCATRIRDILDHALHGTLRAQLTSQMTGTTYRSQALRLMQSNLPLVTGVDIGLGRSTDRELSAWDESFLPARLMDHLRSVTLNDGARRLVASETTLYESTRFQEPLQPPHLWEMLLPVGLLIGALFLWATTRVETSSRVARAITAIVVGTWCLVIGSVGTIVALLWGITDHVAAHANENLLLLSPIWLVVAVALPMGIMRRGVGPIGRWSASLAAGLVVCAVAIHAIALSRQDNWAIIALVAPPTLVVAWAAQQFRSRKDTAA